VAVTALFIMNQVFPFQFFAVFGVPTYLTLQMVMFASLVLNIWPPLTILAEDSYEPMEEFVYKDANERGIFNKYIAYWSYFTLGTT